MKCFFILVIIGAMGIVTEGLNKYMETIPGQHSTDSPCKRVILGTAHVIIATIWNLKPKQWGSPLVQEEKYQVKKTVIREKIK
jgi:hypothetical protein